MVPSGKIIIEPNVNVWPHELKTAKALVAVGYTVKFIRRSEIRYKTSADILMDGVIWEMKAPKSSSPKRIQRTLRDALHQSCYVVFDSRRMKGLPDKVIVPELKKWATELRSLKRLVFVGRGGKVVDIK